MLAGSLHGLPRSVLVAMVTLVALSACGSSRSGLDAVRPPRPLDGAPRPIPDPPPSRVVLHATIFPEGIAAQLEAAVPVEGAGLVDVVAGKGLTYTWTREPFVVRFDRGRLLLASKVTAAVRLLGSHALQVDLRIGGEPVLSPDYQARVQSLTVDVKVTGPLDSVSRVVEKKLTEELTRSLEAFAFDVRPMIAGFYERLRAPLAFAVGTSSACATLEVKAIEAGPTILATSMEKDLGVVVLPSVTLPCVRTSTRAAPPPMLANVAMLPSGPFAVVLPVAAAYEEISAAMEQAIGGRLHFSKEYPSLFLEKPEVFPANESLVIRMQLGGRVRLAGGDLPLEGELFFMGRPVVVDNQIVVPDLQLTPGSADGLLRLKLLLDRDAINRQAQAALRVDISERLAAVRHKLSTELSFSEGMGCVRGEVLRLEVTGLYPHASFLRMYATVHAQASLYIPCKRPFETVAGGR